nr:DUF2714 domain-containing protein [Mycoplasmopsis bovis]
MAQVLLECNLGFNSKEYVKFSEMFNEALDKKYDIVLANFVISFNVNHKFSKLENLKRIEQKVNNDKNILLIDIMKKNRLLSFYVKNALLVSKDDYPYKSRIVNLFNWRAKIFNWFLF